MDLNNIPKYVINLERRPDRLEHITAEFKYMGWDFTLFKGIDLGSYLGCAYSHREIIQQAKALGLEEVAVFEDDVFFMPYAKSFLAELAPVFSNLEYGVLNLNMSIHRPVNISTAHEYLVDLTHLPAKEERHRGIFGTGIIVYHNTVYDTVINLEVQKAIDEHLDRNVYPLYQSYSTILPIACQIPGYSDVSPGEYDSFYTQTYNYRAYVPSCPLPPSYYSYMTVRQIRENTDVLFTQLIDDATF